MALPGIRKRTNRCSWPYSPGCTNFHICQTIHGAERTAARIRLSLILIPSTSAGPSDWSRRGRSNASRTLSRGT